MDGKQYTQDEMEHVALVFVVSVMGAFVLGIIVGAILW